MTKKMTISLIVAGLAVSALIIIPALRTYQNSKEPEKTVQSFAATTTIAAVPTQPTQPTINPADPYDPMPLRVGTVGASVFHRPFCPYAKQSLANHGLPNRINYWTREHVADSNRPGDAYCVASVFDCSDQNPSSFASSTGDPYCGAVIRRDYGLSGLDPALAGKVLCNLQGYIGVFVDDAANCINGQILGSDSSCNQAACSACVANDCSVECTGCVKVHVATLNEIALGLGDANRDGQADLDDYLYYHECYTGQNVSATMPCQNVFDWDSDGDVDVDDYANFAFSYDTGNVTWASNNFPPASFPDTEINTQPPAELPLRVGTEGSLYYHRIDCPSVNNSWVTWGVDRRIDFYTWDHVEASGRIPDVNICLPGIRNNPSGSLQNCTLDDDGDGTLNCIDACPLDPLKIDSGLCGCGKADATPCP